MNDLSIRFIAVFEELMTSNQVKNQIDFCKKIGISPSQFTEIRNNRSQVGIKALHNLVKEFDVDANYLLKGTYSIYNISPEATESVIDYAQCETCSYKTLAERYERDIQRYEREIERLTQTIQELRSGYRGKTKSISA